MTTSNYLKALPVQLFEVDEGIIVKRGCVEFVVHGKEAVYITDIIFSILLKKPCLKEEILERFPVEERGEIESLIDELSVRNIIVPENSPLIGPNEQEEPVDVFHWHFGMSREMSKKTMKKLHFVVVGINKISSGLLDYLADAGATKIDIVDVPVLRNPVYFNDDWSLNTENWRWKKTFEESRWEEEAKPENIDCMIACSDSGGQQLLLKWNEFCVDNNVPFMPVHLQDMVGYIGPFVIPGESPCLECLRARQNSNLDNPNLYRRSELYNGEGRGVPAYHEAMISTVVDFAFFELYKFYNRLPDWHVGKLIELRLPVPSLDVRNILKAPRCPVCSRKKSLQEISIYKTLLVPRYSNQERDTGK